MIIASLHTVDPHSSVDSSNHVYLAEIPSPGDIVITANGQRVRAIRREFLDHAEAEKNNLQHIRRPRPNPSTSRRSHRSAVRRHEL